MSLLRFSLITGTILAALAILLSNAHGQSSSLYVTEPEQATASRFGGAPESTNEQLRDRLAPALALESFIVVLPPRPRQFAVNDLVTIVIRESSSTDLSSSLETEKSVGVSGEIGEFPKLSLNDLINLQLKANNISESPKVEVDFSRDYSGEGDYERKESMSARLQARIIDVKPNGTLVLEARKHLQNDREKITFVVTGTCRSQDIAADNSVLSTELYDLHINKQTEGELKKASRKGILTGLLDLIFNF